MWKDIRGGDGSCGQAESKSGHEGKRIWGSGHRPGIQAGLPLQTRPSGPSLPENYTHASQQSGLSRAFSLALIRRAEAAPLRSPVPVHLVFLALPDLRCLLCSLVSYVLHPYDQLFNATLTSSAYLSFLSVSSLVHCVPHILVILLLCIRPTLIARAFRSV